jgi:hypothetical protein
MVSNTYKPNLISIVNTKTTYFVALHIFNGDCVFVGDSGDKIDIGDGFTKDSQQTKVDYYTYSNANASTAQLWIDQHLEVI